VTFGVVCVKQFFVLIESFGSLDIQRGAHTQTNFFEFITQLQFLEIRVIMIFL
jgi:hypothetical protein